MTSSGCGNDACSLAIYGKMWGRSTRVGFGTLFLFWIVRLVFRMDRVVIDEARLDAWIWSMINDGTLPRLLLQLCISRDSDKYKYMSKQGSVD